MSVDPNTDALAQLANGAGEREARRATVKRYLVWLCAGCDNCDPGPARMPCDSPSANGAAVVLASDYERAEAQLAEAREVLKELSDWVEYGLDLSGDFVLGFGDWDAPVWVEGVRLLAVARAALAKLGGPST